eukprot:SRR837773.25369.p2 GENE.SRR837773.25369~~SRR837773.25369.p2  ORF type:complete len:125 (+),score=13.33 SRR837773.25369:47-376(+)
MCLKFLEREKATIPPGPYSERFLENFKTKIKGGAVPVEHLQESESDSEDASPHVRFYSCDSGMGLLDSQLTWQAASGSSLGESSQAGSRSRTRWQTTQCMGCFSGLWRH